MPTTATIMVINREDPKEDLAKAVVYAVAVMAAVETMIQIIVFANKQRK